MPAGFSTALRQAARHPHPRPATVDPGPRIGLAGRPAGTQAEDLGTRPNNELYEVEPLAWQQL
jgi:hypothetical protein